MKFITTIVFLLPASLCAIAQTAEECSASGNTQYCCDGLLNCEVVAVGAACENQAYCCEGGPAVRRFPVYSAWTITDHDIGRIGQCRRCELCENPLTRLL
jgi:hypothetical protein